MDDGMYDDEDLIGQDVSEEDDDFEEDDDEPMMDQQQQHQQDHHHREVASRGSNANGSDRRDQPANGGGGGGGASTNNHGGQNQPAQQPQQPQQQQPQNGNNNRSRRNRLSDQIDDEPPLRGYKRTEMIGQGAYGIVYRGTKEDTGQTVAIKRIPFADATPEGGVPCNVIREISLLRELDHPNVVKLLDIIQAQPSGLYLVFEFVAHDLKTFMDQSQRSDDISERIGLPMPTVRSFLRQIIAGVGCCHTYRILHRDLKPHNLLISADGKQVKLADFGLARLSAIPNGPYTFEVVTLWYRAPELLLGANRYSTSVDVWSIGCIFAEMVSGIPLFPGRSDIDQIFKIFQRRGTPSASMWPAVVRLPHYNAEFPNWRERPITDFVSAALLGPTGIDLLNKLLAYDPDRRIACKTALQHPFFLQE